MNSPNMKDTHTGKLTARQLQEQKDAKKLHIYTVTFFAVLAILVCIAGFAGVKSKLSSSGYFEKKTVAMTVGDRKVSNAELNFFFVDAANSIYSNYSSLFPYMGIDTSLPLNQQTSLDSTYDTMADYVMAVAKENAHSVYALAAEAEANGYTISESGLSTIESNISYVNTYCTLYGYSNADAYFKAYYGNGASAEGFKEYARISTIANEYQEYYENNLAYSDEQLREKESENFNAYSSYSYNQYYLSASRFEEGGTTDEDGNTTYSDAEKASFVLKAEEAAKSLIADEITTVEQLDAAIAALPVNADSTASSSSMDNTLYSSVNSSVLEWISDASRQSGDKACLPYTSTTTDENGNEVETINGYYVVFFKSVSDNSFPTINVRHILAAFESSTDESGNTVYTDEAKAAAKAKAEELLASWENGEKSEDSFAALANESSDDTGSNENGGLYQNVYPGQMVTAFNDWCFTEGRKAGDTGIVETNYGYHVMYFSGNANLTYRDYLITEDLKESDVSSWYASVIENAPVTDGNVSYINTALQMNNN